MDFTEQELKVIYYALDWMNSPDTFQYDHREFPDIWTKFFGSLDSKEVIKTHKELLKKFEIR